MMQKTHGAAPQTARHHPTRPERVKISDVAAALGLTKGTVSRALNGYPDIAESTQLRVKRAAETMGYRPLAYAQAIRTGRVRAMGLIVEIGEYDSHRPFLAEFLAGVTRGAGAENWTLTVATSVSLEDTQTTLARLVDEHKADGFILPRTRLDDPRVNLLRAQAIPFILYGRTRDTTGCAWFDIVGEDAMRDAVGRLAGQGHRRIAFVNGGDLRPKFPPALRGVLGVKSLTLGGHLVHDPSLQKFHRCQVCQG